MARPFHEVLDEYLEHKAKGPDEGTGYTDKAFYKKMAALGQEMDRFFEGLKEPHHPNCLPTPIRVCKRQVCVAASRGCDC